MPLGRPDNRLAPPLRRVPDGSPRGGGVRVFRGGRHDRTGRDDDSRCGTAGSRPRRRLYQEGFVAGLLGAATIARVVPHPRHGRRPAAPDADDPRHGDLPRRRRVWRSHERCAVLARDGRPVHVGPRARVLRHRGDRRAAPRGGRAPAERGVRDPAALRGLRVRVPRGHAPVRGAGPARPDLARDPRGEPARRGSRWAPTSGADTRISGSLPEAGHDGRVGWRHRERLQLRRA